jgi:hypothetical protein
MFPIKKAYKVTYQRLPADADVKTATELASVRAGWVKAQAAAAETLAKAYAKAGQPVPDWVDAKKNATPPAWLPSDFNGTLPDGVKLQLPKDQAIQQTISSNNGLFAPKQGLEIAVTEGYIDAVTKDAPPAGAYRQVSGGRGRGGGCFCFSSLSTLPHTQTPPPPPPLPPPSPLTVHQSRGRPPQPALHRRPLQRDLLHHPGQRGRHQHRVRGVQRAGGVRGAAG